MSATVWGCAPLPLIAAALGVLFGASCGALGGGAAPDAPVWDVLFDGDTEQLDAGFKGFRSDGVPAGWRVEDGAIVLAEPGCGDLVTRADYDSFELQLEWRISERGNSGIMFHVSEDPEFPTTYWTGPEMQVLDNAVFDGDVNMLHAAGANYALHEPPADFTRPVGEWNAVRIVVDAGQVEYWLNGNLCCSYELGSEDWSSRVQASKFAEMPGYGVQGTGKIVFQDHGNAVAYRDVRVRRLTLTR